MDKYLGIDIGGTFIKYGVYTEDGIKISSSKIKTKADEVDAFVDSLVDIIKENNDVDGIGISMPGFVDVNTGMITDGGAIKPLTNKNLKELIFEKCNKEVDIENDANCVALAEKWIGNGKDYSNFLALTIGTGIGGGIIINDRLYRGNRFMAGEFGYMIVDGFKKGKEQSSTSSFIASTSALISTVCKAKKVAKNSISGEEIFNMIEEKDEDVLKVYNQWIEKIALTIYNLVFTLNPEAVLIGGGVSSQTRVIEEIRKKVDEFDGRTSSFVVIDSCKFNNDSGKIGAIYHHLVTNNKI
ncbi:MAG: ROK family protein [Paraclostridium sp.]